MIPISDDNPTRTVPYVNYVLIATCVLVWLLEWTLMKSGVDWVVPSYGLVPQRFKADVGGEFVTVFSSMFMHGGWAHLAGNMLFLYIFGDNIEDALGHFRYLMFYLLAGVAAAFAQVMVDPQSLVPMVGASGAIAGVMGAYLVLYPRAPVTVLNTIPPLWFVFGFYLVFPAWLVVGEWFVWNLLTGLRSLQMIEGTGGVAFFAHLGGFVLGLLLIRPAMLGRRKAEPDSWRGWRQPARRLPPNAPLGGTHQDPYFPWDRR